MTEAELLATFNRRGEFLFRHGPAHVPNTPAPLKNKLCFTATSLAPIALILAELSTRADCFLVKMDPQVLPNGMVRGRCFLTNSDAIRAVWRTYKNTPSVLCTIQD